ncbi:DUF1801 domain-containing protein [Modestobacter sp. VKM Ac-2979]|uniref:DUF1801 domain-containing protein n=1 Tax=unclassified Modestobacter TaxID=2643866 RepID=UPI0022AB5D2A|nr:MULTISPECIES: DUF1801 domain-containing protein [unclassified Modestobacter]MCZ2814242.1 DUF1801 domain-containing protein [Modestobacter sp. VKM Ac-2979]MCZ2844066.1 DUF1801 domain-containing protein [Modestobacter sp. VKM Ac-2980]
MAQPTVEEFLDALDHPRLNDVRRLRAAIMASDAELTEHVKWRAPSFCARGVDRVTFRLFPADHLQLVFHRGAKPQETAGFAFGDDTGLLRWADTDRAVLSLGDSADVTAKLDAIVALVERWVRV